MTHRSFRWLTVLLAVVGLTADLGSKAKSGIANDLPPLDTCALAIELGASFVARSFSGDKKQLSAVLKAAIAHRGMAMIDVISPCVTFNDHEGSTKSYAYVKDHDEVLGEISFVPFFEDISVEYEPGATIPVTTLCDLAHAWWGDRLALDWRPKTREHHQAILDRLGLTGPFWHLP